MHTRKMETGDIPQIKQIFEAQGFDYEFPSIGSNIIAKRVLCDEHGVPQVGVMARVTVDLYGVFNPAWETPAMRLWALQQLHKEMQIELREKGIEDGHFWCPPQILKSFGRRMMKMFGWKRPEWTDFWRKV
jgi:hypothetical protein